MQVMRGETENPVQKQAEEPLWSAWHWIAISLLASSVVCYIDAFLGKTPNQQPKQKQNPPGLLFLFLM